jgi:hypothetical protein
MLNGHDLGELTHLTLIAFCKEFIDNPYLCYTEHGLHALFFTRLYNAFPEDSRYFYYPGSRKKVCVIQKEYPTHHNLGGPRRQNWDISVICPPDKKPDHKHPYDHFPLAAVVEFSMNYDEKHVKSDIRRLSHKCANVGLRLVAHLYRLGREGRISSRVRSTDSKRIYKKEEIKELLNSNEVVVYYGVADESGERPSELWKLTATGEEKLN